MPDVGGSVCSQNFNNCYGIKVAKLLNDKVKLAIDHSNSPNKKKLHPTNLPTIAGKSIALVNYENLKPINGNLRQKCESKSSNINLQVSNLYSSPVNFSRLTSPIFDYPPNQIKFRTLMSGKTRAGNNDGKLKTNQDSFISLLNCLGIEGFNMFSVLDGHGSHGHFISSCVKSLLKDFILKKSNYSKSSIVTLSDIKSKIQEKNYSFMKQAFAYCEKCLARSKYEVNFSGTTAVLVIQLDGTIICANSGDSRAVMFGKNEIYELSQDHKPNLENERNRIISCGGRVERFFDKSEFVGPYRVWLKDEDFPGLAMSRSIGDFMAKSIGCIFNPEIREFNLKEESMFLVLASDGVWEHLSNTDILKIVKPFYSKRDCEGACSAIIKEASLQWKKVSIYSFKIIYRRREAKTILLV